MKKEFDELAVRYLAEITPKKRENYKPILEKFEEYILNNHNNGSGIDKFFTEQIVKDIIIDAGAYYLDTTDKVTGERAVDKYLRFIRDFKKRIIDVDYPRSTLTFISEKDFRDMPSEIIRKASKTLSPGSATDHIKDWEYKFLINYIDKLRSKTGANSYKNLLVSVVFRLLLLYGFKPETILVMKKGDSDNGGNFDKEKRTLIIYTNNHTIELDLPYTLAMDLTQLESENPSPIWLFSDEKTNQLKSAYFQLHNVIKEHAKKFMIEKGLNENEFNLNSFTLLGIAKYGVINLFLAGVNPTLVKNITGMKDDILDYCQQEAMNLLTKNNLNGYLNSKIRYLPTYGDFQ